MVKRLKGRSAKLLLAEYPELKRRYWGGHLWGIGMVLGRGRPCGIGSITDELLQAYLDHHKNHPNGEKKFILE